MTSIDKIEELVQQELTEANAEHPQFHSDHEAWAVIAEECEECGEEAEMMGHHLQKMWFAVKINEDCRVELKLLKHRAMSIIQEAIQVAAMCEKGLARYEREKEDDEKM